MGAEKIAFLRANGQGLNAEMAAEDAALARGCPRGDSVRAVDAAARARLADLVATRKRTIVNNDPPAPDPEGGV